MHWFFSQTFIENNSFIPYLQTNTHVPDHIRQHYAKTILDHDQDAIPQENRCPPYIRPNYDSGDSEIWDKIKDQILDPYHYPLMAKNHEGSQKPIFLLAIIIYCVMTAIYICWCSSTCGPKGHTW